MIVVRIWEGLGNQMFQYAYARALVAKGQDVVYSQNIKIMLTGKTAYRIFGFLYQP